MPEVALQIYLRCGEDNHQICVQFFGKKYTIILFVSPRKVMLNMKSSSSKGRYGLIKGARLTKRKTSIKIAPVVIKITTLENIRNI